MPQVVVPSPCFLRKGHLKRISQQAPQRLQSPRRRERASTASTVGASIRQGAHQGAQKSTSTGLSELSTSDSKLLSLTSLTKSLMISNLLRLLLTAVD